MDASAGMLAAFEALAAAAGIRNARAVKSDWLAAEGIQGDVTLVSSVTYFVRDIVPFVRKLEAASRRRVIILVWSEPATQPPEQALSPGLRRRTGAITWTSGAAAGLVGDGHSARCPCAPEAAHTGGLASTCQVSPDVRRGDGVYPDGTVAFPRRP